MWTWVTRGDAVAGGWPSRVTHAGVASDSSTRSAAGATSSTCGTRSPTPPGTGWSWSSRAAASSSTSTARRCSRSASSGTTRTSRRGPARDSGSASATASRRSSRWAGVESGETGWAGCRPQPSADLEEEASDAAAVNAKRVAIVTLTELLTTNLNRNPDVYVFKKCLSLSNGRCAVIGKSVLVFAPPKWLGHVFHIINIQVLKDTYIHLQIVFCHQVWQMMRAPIICFDNLNRRSQTIGWFSTVLSRYELR